MLCRTLADASVQAQANANASGNAWVFFSDTSGKARCEAAPEFTGTANVRCQRKWSGVLVTVVQPEDGFVVRKAYTLLQEGGSSYETYAVQQVILLTKRCGSSYPWRGVSDD